MQLLAQFLQRITDINFHTIWAVPFAVVCLEVI